MRAELLVCELRADGRRVHGIAIPYGETATVGRFRERFEPGSVEIREPAVLNDRHRPFEPLAVLTFADTAEALRFEATLPDGPRQDAALAAIDSGELRGASVEFAALAEAVESGVRVIRRAVVWAAALTARPVYTETMVETRERAAADDERVRRALAWYL